MVFFTLRWFTMMSWAAAGTFTAGSTTASEGSLDLCEVEDTGVSCTDLYSELGADLGEPAQVRRIDADGDGVYGFVSAEATASKRADSSNQSRRGWHCEPASGTWACTELFTGNPSNTGYTITTSVGDFDGDGDDDIVFVNGDPLDDVSYCDNDSGSFTCASLGFAASNYAVVSAPADFDGDGNLDLFIGNRFIKGRVCLGDGAGAFSCSAAGPSSNAWHHVTGDFDGDGLDELVVGYNTVQVCDWDASSSAMSCATESSAEAPYRKNLRSGDVDGDGLPDFVAADSKGICYSDGDGTFTCDSAVVVTDILGDIDGDDVAEVVSSSGADLEVCEVVSSALDACTSVTLPFTALQSTSVEWLAWSSDRDGDGVDDADDAFPDDPTEDADTDGDGVGDNADLCEGDDATGDTDGDAVCDVLDVCDGDDATGDSDSDGTCDDSDDFPDDASEQVDSDGDGVGDNGDLFPDDATESTDADADGVGDNSDPCTGFPNDDTDEDGVCDDSDVCPTDADDADEDNDSVCDVDDLCVGTDNVDSDGDQICDDLDLCEGNDASGDADEDGTCDLDDNCPDDANADQADSDGDGIGDTCDGDGDLDGVSDDDDNCPDDANADQADLDEDGTGDVCDDDDDDDDVSDADDNCPLVDNADQDDTDGDGYGDACDGDDDGDGVSDDADSCPGTALASPFDEQGCSGEQRVELYCGEPDDYGWWRRSRYVRCVNRESRSAYREGLLTRSERAHIVRRALNQLWWVRYIRRLLRWC